MVFFSSCVRWLFTTFYIKLIGIYHQNLSRWCFHHNNLMMSGGKKSIYISSLIMPRARDKMLRLFLHGGVSLTGMISYHLGQDIIYVFPIPWKATRTMWAGCYYLHYVISVTSLVMSMGERSWVQFEIFTIARQVCCLLKLMVINMQKITSICSAL